MKYLIFFTALAFVSCEKPQVVTYEGTPEPDTGSQTPEGDQSALKLEDVISTPDGSIPVPVPMSDIKPVNPTPRLIPPPTPPVGGKPIPIPTPETNTQPTPTPPEYRTAAAIPGKPGFLFNPWTNGEVDVRGVPPGSLVRDPKDPNPDHKFRTP
jgi:hypothetical protein